MKLVKLITDDDGRKVDRPAWHYVTHWSDGERTLCSGEVFGPGESQAEYKEKEVDKGGITCNRCLAIIKEIKAIKL